jgi:hypothetical protein
MTSNYKVNCIVWVYCERKVLITNNILCALPEHNSTISAKQNTVDSKIFMTLVGKTGPDKSEQWAIKIIQQSLGVGAVITA